MEQVPHLGVKWGLSHPTKQIWWTGLRVVGLLLAKPHEQLSLNSRCGDRGLDPWRGGELFEDGKCIDAGCHWVGLRDYRGSRRIGCGLLMCFKYEMGGFWRIRDLC